MPSMADVSSYEKKKKKLFASPSFTPPPTERKSIR